MNTSEALGMSRQIRKMAVETYIAPARRAGKTKVTIAVRDMMQHFGSEAKGRQSIFCSALRAKAFLRPNRLQLETLDGPPSGRGTSTIYHYRFEDTVPMTSNEAGPVSKEEAERLADIYLEPLRGLLAREIAAFGGGEGFLTWVRSEEPQQ